MKSTTLKTNKRPNSPKAAGKAVCEPRTPSTLPAQPGRTKAAKPPPALPVVISKKRAIEAMLRDPEGAGMAELMTATGWQAHSVRAALTGFRKAGCTIERGRSEAGTRYRIVGVA